MYRNNIWKKRKWAPKCCWRCLLLGVGTALRLQKDGGQWSNSKDENIPSQKKAFTWNWSEFVPKNGTTVGSKSFF